MLTDYYTNEYFVNIMPLNDPNNLEDGFLNAESCNNTNRIDILVFGNANQVLISSRLDNLGKGASGAAIQNMNLMLGVGEITGLKKFNNH